jgi:DNA-binding NarL/FixJ family response regulator
VDDHPVVREGVAAILADANEIELVGAAGSGKEALWMMPRVRPGICLVDVRLPEMSGIELCSAITRRHPGVRTIMLSAQGDSLTIDAAFAAGARGFLLKTSDPSVIVATILAVASGDVVLDPVLEARSAPYGGSGKSAKGPFGLSPQEMRVLEYLPRGLTNKEIGDELGIAEGTVKTHIGRILFKLEARHRAEAVAIAHREGLL